ncbi:MAG: NCS2 family permease [Clostridia bacterium]|nr:NCS2 family permease [Clostridia bacterium]
MLEKIFKLKENKTTVLTEFIAGLTTFMAMAYVIFINPAILSNTGMDYNAVYVATIIASMIGTIFLGVVANVPYVQSAGLGLNALFTYTICGTMGFTWQQALAMVFICGVINVLITVTSIRKRIIKAIPEFMQEAITVGIGLFIAYIGIKSAGLIEFSVSAVNNGIALAGDTVPQLALFNNKEVILALIGIVLTGILVSKKVKNSYLISIIATTIIGIFMGVTTLPDFSNYSAIPSLEPTFLKLDFKGLFTAEAGIVVVIMTIFALVISDLFDTIGTFIGTGKKSGIFKLDENGNMPKNLEKALACDSSTTILGALLGTSNVTTYVESSVGIEAGGRTGLTAVFAALCFGLSLFLSPIVACVPMAAIAPILIFVGLSMLENIVKINWKDIIIAIPAFFIIIMMPLSYSITTGIQFGFIMYAIVSLVNKKGKEVSPIIYILSLLFIFSFIYNAIS